MIPADIEKRAKYNRYVEQAVQLMREQDTLKEDLKNVKEIVSEELGKDQASSFSGHVKARYDEQKVSDQADKLQESIEEHRILIGQ